MERTSLVLNGSTYSTEQIDTAQGTLWISLLVDVSNQNEQTLPEFKEQLIDAVNGLPENARVALVPFSRAPMQSVDTYRTAGELPALINQIQPSEPNAASCLYNTVYSGLESLSSRSPRRLLILVTGSEDNAGGGSFSPCSQQTVSSVINYSESRAIPINVIKLGTSGDSQRLAAQSVGAYAMVGVPELGDVLGQMIESQGEQWLARFSVFAPQGSQTASFQAILSDGAATTPVDVQFQTTTTASAPGRPVSVQVNGVSIDVATTPPVLDIALEVTNRDAIHALDMSVLRDGVVQYAETGVQPSAAIRLEVPGLDNGTYTLLVIARDTLGVELTRADEFEFDFTTASADIVVNNVTIQYEQDTLQAAFGLNSIEDAMSIQLLILAEGVVVFSGTAPFSPSVSLPLNAVLTADTQYHLIATVLDLNNVELTRSPAYEFTYAPPVPGATIIAVSVTYGERLDDPATLLVFVDVRQSQAISGYQLWLVDAHGARVDDFSAQTPITNPLEIQTSQLKTGEQTLYLRPLDLDGALISTEPSTWKLQLTVPDTPLLARIFGFARSSWVIVGAIGLLALLSVGVTREMMRRASQHPTPNLNPVQQVQAASSPASTKQRGEARKNRAIPKATLVVIAPTDNRAYGKPFTVTSVPYYLGRDLAVLGDLPKAVSRKHAIIQYDRQQGFMLTDNRSHNGTKLNESLLKPEIPTPLGKRAKITLGAVVQLEFIQEDN